MKKPILKILLPLITIVLTGCQNISVSPVLDSLSINGEAITNEYQVGDIFNPDGLEVVAKYSNNTTSIIPINECIWKDSITNTYELSLETNSVTCEYKDKSAVYEGIKVYNKNIAEWTIMFYMCGADLESLYGCATNDIDEILNNNNQPDNVNIIFECGGASLWKSKYSSIIDKSRLTRMHVENKSLVVDEYIAKANMGASAALQSYIEWGLEEYPAKRTMFIFWNHGNAMAGVCFDENYHDDGLLNSEVNLAFKNAFSNLKRTKKLEVVGYDACSMSLQDVADFNSEYFNYMIASEELENDSGWAYDSGWLQSIFDNPTACNTETVLTNNVKGFIASFEGMYGSWEDQTLACYNLNKMPSYKASFEALGDYLYKEVLNSSMKSKFLTLIKGVKAFGCDGEGFERYLGIFDVVDFLDKLEASATFNTLNAQQYIDDVRASFHEMMVYSECERNAGNSNGLALYFDAYGLAETSRVYTSLQTNFTNWRLLNGVYKGQGGYY